MTNAPQHKRCPVCGREFTTRKPWQKYDTLRCGWRARQARRQERVREAVKLLDRFSARTGTGGR